MVMSRGSRWSVEQYDAYIRQQQAITDDRLAAEAELTLEISGYDDLPRHEKIRKAKPKSNYDKEEAREQRRIMKKYPRPNKGFEFCISTLKMRDE
jgi:hypothetical protein